MKQKDIVLVSIQMALLLAYLFRVRFFDFSCPNFVRHLGLILSIIGIIIVIISILILNRNLTPFPTPKASGELVETSIYKYIRHPIYTGILAFTFGYAFYSENAFRLIIFVMLVFLFQYKASYEESMLEEKFPTYASYKQRSGKFLPKI